MGNKDLGRQATQTWTPDDSKQMNLALYIILVFTTIFLYDSGRVSMTTNFYYRTDFILIVLLFHKEVNSIQGKIGRLVWTHAIMF